MFNCDINWLCTKSHISFTTLLIKYSMYKKRKDWVINVFAYIVFNILLQSMYTSGHWSNCHCLNICQLWTSAVIVAMFRRQTQNQYIIQTWKFWARQLNFAQVMFIFLCHLIGLWAYITTSDWPTSDNGHMIPHCTSCICDVRSERELGECQGTHFGGNSIHWCFVSISNQTQTKYNTTLHWLARGEATIFKKGLFI